MPRTGADTFAPKLVAQEDSSEGSDGRRRSRLDQKGLGLHPARYDVIESPLSVHVEVWRLLLGELNSGIPERPDTRRRDLPVVMALLLGQDQLTKHHCGLIEALFLYEAILVWSNSVDEY